MIKRLLKRSHNQAPASAKQNDIAVTDVFVVHIPKTAGTSFKKALDNGRYLEMDYGDKSPETTKLVKQYVYNETEPYRLRYQHSEKPFSLMGHVVINAYSDMYDIRNIITFIREPVAQVISHFNHYVNNYQFKGEFSNFYQNNAFINLHGKHLLGFPLSLIGHVGITEHYAQSLTLINAHLDLGLKELEHNKRAVAHKDVEWLSSQERQQIVELNTKDIELYHEGVHLHHQRMAMHSSGKPWAHLHAHINVNNVMHGCAYYAESDDTVELAITVNGDVVEESIKATDFYGAYPKYHFPRARYIGFRFPLAKFLPQDIESIELVVKSTGQTYQVVLPERFKA